MQRRPRLLLRILVLAGVITPFLSFTQWPVLMAWLSSASPFVALCAALGGRHLALISLAALPLLILALIKERWFCRHLCPTGFILDSTCRKRRQDGYLISRMPYVGAWLFFAGLGLAAVGFPLLMTLDPLVILSGFLSTWQWRHLDWILFLPALPLLGLIAFNIFWPDLWCQRICPLGATQHYLGVFGKLVFRLKTHQFILDKSSSPAGIRRRNFLFFLLGGIAGSAMGLTKSGSAVLVRPPGAVDEDRFTAMCARCGNCINACPESIILPDTGSSGLQGLLTPILKFRNGYCNEWCFKCLQACPTSAIRRMSLAEKRMLTIGTARIDKTMCLAWAGRQHCMVCQEFCPYQAIAIIEKSGVNCPEVKEEVCRGCGACENQCPAIPGKAIVVRGRPVQVKIADKRRID